MSIKPQIIVMGASTGGLVVLHTILSALPKAFSLPIVIAQHRTKDAGGDLVSLLQTSCLLPVVEPDDKDPIMPGCVSLAPADYHLLVEKGHFALSVDEAIRHSRPAIDILFDSAAAAYGAGVLGVILTGANEDGVMGAARIHACGGTVIVQDPKEAEASIMPAAVIKYTKADQVLSVKKIGELVGRIEDCCHSGNV